MAEKTPIARTLKDWIDLGYEAVMNPNLDRPFQVTVGEALCIKQVSLNEKIPDDLAAYLVKTHPILPSLLGEGIELWNTWVDLGEKTAEAMSKLVLGQLLDQLSIQTVEGINGLKRNNLGIAATVLISSPKS